MPPSREPANRRPIGACRRAAPGPRAVSRRHLPGTMDGLCTVPGNLTGGVKQGGTMPGLTTATLPIDTDEGFGLPDRQRGRHRLPHRCQF